MEILSKLSIKRNYVLVKPDADHETLKVKGSDGDVELDLVPTFETEARHYGITGTVLKVPEALVYRGRQVIDYRKETETNRGLDEMRKLGLLRKGSLDHETEMELEVGDRVWFDYKAHMHGNTEQKSIDIEGHGNCLLMRYDMIFMRERDLNMAPINGWIWIKDIEGSRDLGNGLVLPDTIDVTPKGVGEIVKLGKAITHHADQEYNLRMDAICIDGKLEDLASNVMTHGDLRPGMIVHFREKAAIPLEYSMHETLGLEGLKKIRFKDIKYIELAKETV